MDFNYKIKYLKYKAKYFKLLEQNGNGQVNSANKPNTVVPVNSLLVTHNGRIRCLLDLIKMSAIDEITKKEVRFMNCCILLLSIEKSGFTLSLKYEGELADESIKKAKKEGRKYYSTENNNDIYIKFLEKKSSDLSLLQLKPEDIDDKTYNFYIIRHGDGVHNSMSAFQKATSSSVTDAELTLGGIRQAEKANKFLSSIQIHNLYTSDLKRTRQTLGKLIEGNKSIQAKEVVVLPCAHELDYVQGKSCDAYQGVKSALSYENKPICSADKSTCNLSDVCCQVNGLPINWSFYRAFYGQGTRMAHGTGAKSCRDTNMIKQAFEHMVSIK